MRRWLPLALGLAATALTMLPVCNLLFDCGCTWPLLGGLTHCNIHRPAPPHCPACANWGIGAAFAAVLTASWTGLIVLARRLF